MKSKNKRKKKVAHKRAVASKEANSYTVRAERYYQHICRVIKRYGPETDEFKKLLKLKESYEQIKKNRNNVNRLKRQEKREKPLKTYRSVILTNKLDKIDARIKECDDPKKLEKLKAQRLVIKNKLYAKQSNTNDTRG